MRKYKKAFQFGWLCSLRVYLLICSSGLACVENNIDKWQREKKQLKPIEIKPVVLFSSLFLTDKFLPLVEVVCSLPLIYAAPVGVEPEAKPRGQSEARRPRGNIQPRCGRELADVQQRVQLTTCKSALTLCGPLRVPSGTDCHSLLPFKRLR